MYLYLFWFLKASPLEGLDVVRAIDSTLPENSYKTFLRTMRSLTAKENHIGSVVSKILWYRDTHTDAQRSPVALL